MSTALSSGALATGSTTTLLTGRSFLNSIILIGDGTNAPTVTVYDNIAGSGAILAQVKGVATGVYTLFNPSFAIRGDVGLTVVVAGTGASAIVHFGAA